MNIVFVTTCMGLLLVFIMVINWLVNWIGHHHYSKSSNLYDIVQEHTPDLHQYEWVLDLIILVFFGSLLILDLPNSFIWNFTIRIMLILLLRALTTISTILPKHEACETDPTTFFAFLRGGCYDKVFSGHTAIITLFCLMFKDAGILNTVAASSIALGYGLLMTMTRAHYTADVVLAYVITYLVYDGDYTAVDAVAKPIYKNLFKS